MKMEEKLRGWWKKENDWIRKCQRSGEGGRIRKERAGKKRSISENVKKKRIIEKDPGRTMSGCDRSSKMKEDWRTDEGVAKREAEKYTAIEEETK